MQKKEEKPISIEVLNPFKNVLIIGTGAIGSLFKAELTKNNKQIEVTLVSHGDITEELLVGVEVIILATPNQTVKEMVTSVLEKIPEDVTMPTIVLIQNGVGVVEQALDASKDRKLPIVRGSVFTQVTKTGEELEYNAKKLRIALSPVAMNQNLDRVNTLFSAAEFKTETYENYKSLEWTKLLFNTLGSTSMITGLPPSITFEDEELYQLEMNAFAQRCEILRQCKIPISKIDWVKTQMLPALEVVRHISFFKPARKALAGLISQQRNDQPSAAWQKVEAGGDLTEAIHYLQAFIDLAIKYNLTPSALDLAIVFLLQEQAANKLNLQDLTPDERKQRLIAKTRKLKTNN